MTDDLTAPFYDERYMSKGQIAMFMVLLSDAVVAADSDEGMMAGRGFAAYLRSEDMREKYRRLPEARDPFAYEKLFELLANLVEGSGDVSLELAIDQFLDEFGIVDDAT